MATGDPYCPVHGFNPCLCWALPRVERYSSFNDHGERFVVKKVLGDYIVIDEEVLNKNPFRRSIILSRRSAKKLRDLLCEFVGQPEDDSEFCKRCDCWHRCRCEDGKWPDHIED